MSKVICDWSQCMRVADFHVRCDVPHKDTLFTTFLWSRCGDHVPPLRPGTKLTDLATGNVQSMPMAREGAA
jgi:hypothetical protein